MNSAGDAAKGSRIMCTTILSVKKKRRAWRGVSVSA
jgi:hypothetical protein